MRTGIILVGGEARRAGGKEKYFFTFGEKTFIERLIETMRGIVDEIVVVAKDPAQCERFRYFEDIRVISDIRTGLGPIGGIHAGVRSASGDILFIVACDMPCINAAVVEQLFSLLDDYDAVIPCWDTNKLEPLHAVYRRDALLSYLQEHDSLSLRDMVRSLRSRYVKVHDLRSIDPELKTFININKIEDLEQIVLQLPQKEDT